MTKTDGERREAKIPLGRPSTWLGLILAVVLFLVAVRLLGIAAESYSAALRGPIERAVGGSLSALGTSWLASYGVLNGSVVAALGLALHGAGLVPADQMFLMLAGSRLGAAGVVVLIGLLEYLQHRRYGFRKAIGLGVLVFLVTHAITVPVTIVGAGLEQGLGVSGRLAGALPAGLTGWGAGASAVEERLLDGLGRGLLLLLAGIVVVVSLRLFDVLLDRVDKERVRDEVFVKLDNRWVSFLVGLGVTAVSTSVMFSLGVVVPLYNRGYVTRGEMGPYILGAGVGTFSDTVLVALVVGSSTGLASVLLLVGLTGVATGLALVFYARFWDGVEAVRERIVSSRRATVAFLASLVVVPALLAAVGWIFGA